MKTASEKLGVKPGMAVMLLDAPVGVLDSLPAGAHEVLAAADADVVVLFASSHAWVRVHAPTVFEQLKPGALVWIAFRKGRKTDVDRDSLMPSLVDLGWHGVSLVSIDENWSAARFRPLDQIDSRSLTTPG